MNGRLVGVFKILCFIVKKRMDVFGTVFKILHFAVKNRMAAWIDAFMSLIKKQNESNLIRREKKLMLCFTKILEHWVGYN